MLGDCQVSTPLIFLPLCSVTFLLSLWSLCHPHTTKLNWLQTGSWHSVKPLKMLIIRNEKEGRNERNRHLFTAGIPWSVWHSFPSSPTFYLVSPYFFLSSWFSFLSVFHGLNYASHSHHCQNMSTVNISCKNTFSFTDDELVFFTSLKTSTLVQWLQRVTELRVVELT